MQFRVVIPEHVHAGQTIRIHCPDDTEANVKVPMGLKPGDSFIFELSVDQLTDPQSLLEMQKKNDAAAAASAGSNNRKKGSSKKRSAGTNAASKSSSSGSQPQPAKRGFLDREIASMQDFLLALGVGLVIGAGIVIGFILGVLSVTQDLTPAANVTKIPETSSTTTTTTSGAFYSHSQNIPQTSTNNYFLGTASTFSTNNAKLKNTISPPKIEL